MPVMEIPENRIKEVGRKLIEKDRVYVKLKSKKTFNLLPNQEIKKDEILNAYVSGRKIYVKCKRKWILFSEKIEEFFRFVV